MPEPTAIGTAAGVTGVVILVLGPDVGATLAPLVADMLLVVGGALVGVMHAMSKITFKTRAAAAAYVFRWVAIAVVITGALCVAIEQLTHFPATRWPWAIACLLTFLADRWPAWLDRYVWRRQSGPEADPPVSGPEGKP